MGYLDFDIPVDDREREKIERGVRYHHHKDAACDRENCSEDKAGDHGMSEAMKRFLAGTMSIILRAP